MNKTIIASGLLLVNPLMNSATAGDLPSSPATTVRMCFDQPLASSDTTLQAVIDVNSTDHTNFNQLKCSHYWSYFQNAIDFTDANGVTRKLQQSDCPAHPELMHLRQGYAPFGVFFRGWQSTPKAGITNYAWEIRGPMQTGQNFTQAPLVANYNGYNAGHIFETPGLYQAQLTVTSSTGTTVSALTDINVWSRKGRTFYVDSDIGDDRNNGQQTTLSARRCDPALVSGCPGPFKTATRAFSALAPRTSTASTAEYKAADMCAAWTTQSFTQYTVGNLAVLPTTPFLQSLAVKDASGNYKTADFPVCSQLKTVATSLYQAGDQILFKRGQSFKFDVGINGVDNYTLKDNNGVTATYQQKRCNPLVYIPHWGLPAGVHFGAYGTGAKPLIQNVSDTGECDAFSMYGVGQMRLSFADLSFDLQSGHLDEFSGKPERATFMFAPGSDPLGMAFARVDLKRFTQGIVMSTNGSAQGLFLFDSNTYDSDIVHLYTQASFRDVALVRNNMDYSGNHIAYTSLANAFLFRNTFSKPAFGRTALRVYGGSFTAPNHHVWIEGNQFLGWIDPRTGDRQYADGKRYNYQLVEFAPNGPGDLIGYDLVFRRNNIQAAETWLKVSSWADVKIEANNFETRDTGGVTRVKLGTEYQARPLRNIRFSANTFTDYGNTDLTPKRLFDLQKYNGPECSDQSGHVGIAIENNAIYPSSVLRYYDYDLNTSTSYNLVNNAFNLGTELSVFGNYPK